MAYIDGFENDIFISYSHIDDQPFGEDQRRWVSKFHRDLQVRIQSYLGAPARVWRDAKLDGTDIFSDEIASQLKGAAILVSVLSPGYIRSDWCRKELQLFLEAAAQTGGFRVGNKERIVKVIKTPVPREELPEVLDAILGYEFYRVEEATEYVREFLLDPSAEARQAYWAKLDDLAQDIRKVIELISRRKGGGNPASPAQGTVYLAEATSDLQRERDKLRRELQDRNYQVLPDRPLPWNARAVVEAVHSDVQRSNLSIHLLGARYGMIPEGEERSIVVLQNEIAAQREEKPFFRLLWIPPGLQIVEETQKEFIDSVRQYSGMRNGFELLETPLEDLKTVVLDRLRTDRSPTHAPQEEDGLVRIYLVCDQRDRSDVRPLRNYLSEKGFEVTLPLNQGDVAQMREDHQENLLLCDAVLLYWGFGDEFWLRAKLRDLARVRGLGRSRPFLAKLIYMGNPDSPEKEDLRTNEALLVRQFDAFSAETLEPFLTQIQRAKEAAK